MSARLVLVGAPGSGKSTVGGLLAQRWGEPFADVDTVIEARTGKSVAELSTEKGRESAKGELLEKIKKAYVEEDKELIMDIYYTAFVTQ